MRDLFDTGRLTALLDRAAHAHRPSALPWARPRFELALIALVAIAVLLPLPSLDSQDVSRVCLAQAMFHGHLSNTSCLSGSVDYSSYDGRLYSDKAPGLSLLELPSVALLDPVPFHGTVDLRLWGVRVLTVGLALLACVFLVGRVTEGLAPGYGGIVMVTFGLGTIAGSLVQVSFEEVPAALALFAAFLLGWAKRPLLAGLVAGAALVIEYASALTIALLALYLACAGWASLRRYALGVIPGTLLLGAYDWAAFGAPWHLSYRYVSPQFAAEQGTGFFGIGLPTLHGLFAVFGDDGGLLFVSPVLAVAAYGLVRLYRTHPAEALLASSVTVLMVLLNVGYFLPYGGTSPGARFLIPALPFLALGLAPGFARRPRVTLVLAVVSIATTTAITLVWASEKTIVMQRTVWGEIARIPFDRGSAPYIEALSPNLLTAFGLGKAAGVGLIILAVAGAAVLAARSMPRLVPADTVAGALRAHPVTALLLAVVALCAIYTFPYGNGFEPRTTPVTVAVARSPVASYLGGEVNFTVTARDASPIYDVTDVIVTFVLGPAMNLVGPAKASIGPGCTGSDVIVCQLGYMEAEQSGNVWFGVQFSEPGTSELSVRVSSSGTSGPKPTVVAVPVGS